MTNTEATTTAIHACDAGHLSNTVNCRACGQQFCGEVADVDAWLAEQVAAAVAQIKDLGMPEAVGMDDGEIKDEVASWIGAWADTGEGDPGPVHAEIAVTGSTITLDVFGWVSFIDGDSERAWETSADTLTFEVTR